MRATVATLAFATAALLACSGTADVTPIDAVPAAPLTGAGTLDSPHQADCWTTAMQLGKSAAQLDYVACPSGCTSGMIWGTGRYTGDSKVCVAGVHAGVLTNGGSGTILVKLDGSYGSFTGSEANGVKSESWSATSPMTFSVAAAVAEPRGGKAGKGGDGEKGEKGEKGGKGGKAR